MPKTIAPKTPVTSSSTDGSTCCSNGNGDCNNYVSCAKSMLLAVLIFLSIFVLLLVLMLIYYLCKYFGVRYFVQGAYHYDFVSDNPEQQPVPKLLRPGIVYQRDVFMALNCIRVAINLPMIYERGPDSTGPPLSNLSPNLEFWNFEFPGVHPEIEQRISLPPGTDIQPIWGKDRKMYAVFLHFGGIGLTVLCWINLRYVKQWRCFVDLQLKVPEFLESSELYKSTGKCWTCTQYFYGLVRDELWDKWNRHFRHRTQQFLVAGHSLGGAMVPLAAMDFRCNDSSLNHHKMFVHISGAPRCGDPEFVQRFNQLIPNAWNLRNTYDVICITPPYFAKRRSFHHVGTEWLFSHAHEDGLWASHLLKSYLEFFQDLSPLQHRLLTAAKDS